MMKPMESAAQDRSDEFGPPHSGMRTFPTTLWTIVLDAGQRTAAETNEALANLCRAYWYPLYAFVRRRGYSAHDAEDLTQAFFAHLLEKQGLGTVDREKGRFRTFLLASLKNYLANEWDKAQALKRGGGRLLVSFECETAESRYQLEPSHELTAERLFERRWALSVLDQALVALKAGCEREGNGPLFSELKETLTGAGVGYAEIAARLGRTEEAVKVAAHRLRRRYRDLTRSIIAETVTDDEIDDEMRHLKAAISGS
jgi:RNA polymerase sigma factor (sigma-70 family)